MADSPHSLREILARYRELTTLLEDPDVATNQARVVEIMKERGLLAGKATKAEEWIAKKAEIEETKALLEDEEMADMARDELASLEPQLQALTEDLADEMGADEAESAKSVIVEIRPGAGGDEAALFAGELFEMYSRWAESNRFKTEVIDIQRTELGGLREVQFSVKGNGVYRMLKFESGGHRVQRVPATETQGRVHTSAATVAVLPEPENVNIDIKEEELKIDTMRAGGPGGQKVNKTESAIRITHIPTGIVVKCQDEKSQHKNRARAMRVLESRLYERIRSERDAKRAAARKEQVGSGDRSERIRTYNFPQDRCSDHRLDFNLPRLPDIMQGKIDPLIEALRKRERAMRLAELDLDELENTE